MPSSAARFSSMTSIVRPLASAMARASSARTCGRHVVGGPVREPSRGVRALADDPAALGAALGVRGLAVAHEQDQLVEGRRRRVAVLAVDGLRLERPLDDAARHELGRQGGVAAEAAGDRRQPDRHRADLAVDQPPDRAPGDAPRGLPVEVVGVAGRDHQHALDPDVAGGRRGPSRSACR